MFGGCEKPMLDVLTSPMFNSQFEPLLLYRYSDEYSHGLALTYPTFPLTKTKGVRLPAFDSWSVYLERKLSDHLLLFKVANRIAWLLYRLFFPFIFLYEFFCLYFIFRMNRAGIIHINNGGYPGALSCRIAAIVAILAGIPTIVYSVHNMAVGKRSYFDRFLDRLIGASVAVFITGSKAAGNALVANIGFDREKIINIYHGVGSAKASPASNTALGQDTAQYLLMIADFEVRKGHQYLIAAFKQLLSESPQYKKLKLVLIGDGPTLRNCKLLVTKEQLEANVVFLGRRTDYRDYLASCLFLLNPSLGLEDLPYIILEAMSFGVPVIGTNVAGIPEEIENGVSGIIVPPGKIESLVLAIDTLLSDQVLRAKIGQAAKKRFADMFTVNKMINRYLDIYNKL
jgi:glycosyltransferase involved in cell wall biosynthesis